MTQRPAVAAPAITARASSPASADPACALRADPHQGSTAAAAQPPAELPALERLSNRTTAWAGSSSAFIAVMLLVVVWMVLGPATHFSNAWQLVMNTISSIVTFIMVFLIQRAQNKESLAVHIKLNELIAAKEGARNALINAEDLSEAELRRFHAHFGHLISQLPPAADSGRAATTPPTAAPP